MNPLLNTPKKIWLNCINISVQTNPCKCGYFPNLDRCQCTLAQVKSYLARLSQPLLDRLDICVETERPDKIHWDDRGESSAEIRQRIIRTREIQRERYREESVTKNSQLRGHLMEKYCYLGKEERRLLNDFMETHYLSVRGKSRIIRVARTLADMEGCDRIGESHLLEAASYKVAGSRYWEC